MPNPAETNYTVISGDTLHSIAVRVYGNSFLWRKIYDANTETIGSNPDVIKPGQLLFIPPEDEILNRQTAIDETKITGNTISLFIEGKNYTAKQGRFGWALDSIATSWNADMEWNPGKDIDFDTATARGSFAESKLYLMGRLVASGRLYTRTNHIGINEITKNLVFYSITKDLVDSTLSPKWLELDKSTIKDIAENICGALGYRVTFLDPPGAPFEYIQRQDGETAGKYLQRLAAQRGLFISCDPSGALVFQKLHSDEKPVTHIDLTGRNVTDYQTTYDDTARYAQYVAYATSADGTARVSAIAKDPQVPGSRQLVFKTDDCGEGEIDTAVEWTMLKLNLQAAELKLPVSSWTTPSGELWEPNTIITVKSPVLLETGKTMRYVIRGVEFEWTASSRTAVLSLVPPLYVENGKLQWK